MTFEELKQLDEQYVVQTYSRNPIAIDHGQGATLYDLEGKEYIDFASGIGVLSVGTAHPKWQAAISAQAAKLGHISNLYYSEPYILLAQKLCTRSGMAAAFFGNSGAEGNEGILLEIHLYYKDSNGSLDAVTYCINSQGDMHADGFPCGIGRFGQRNQAFYEALLRLFAEKSHSPLWEVSS